MEATATSPEPGSIVRHGPVASAIVLAGVTLAVGLVKIGRSFNYDEAITYSSFINGGSLRRALTTQVVFNNHQMFSAIQSVAWRLGFVGETAQRLGPVLCGAVTVGALTWATARRVGVIGGVAAGTVLLLNPVYLAEFRSLRGYSLATMCVVLSALALRRSWDDERARWLVGQGALMVVAVTTHAYSVVAILIVAAATVAMGRLRAAHVATWGLAAVTAFAIQLPLLDDAIEQSRARGSLFRDDFVWRAGRLLLGQSVPVVVITAALAGVGLWTVGRRSRRHALSVAIAIAIVVVVVGGIWLVLQPRDLFARFFVSLLPFLAAAVGVGVSRLPRVPAVAVIALVAGLLAPDAREILRSEAPIRDAAAVVEAGQQLGLELCGYQAEPLVVYAPPVRLINGVDDFEDCELYVSVLRLRPEAVAAARERFGDPVSLGGVTYVWGDADVVDGIVP